MTPFAALVAAWAVFMFAVLLYVTYTTVQDKPTPRWLLPAFLICLNVLIAASIAVLRSGVKP